MRRARWIRFGPADVLELRAAARVLAAERARDADPIVLWGSARAARGGAEPQFAFVTVAPLRVAPGKSARWTAWMLSPVVAAYRDFGVRAYLEGARVALRGRCIASARAEAGPGCAVISAELGAAFGKCAGPSASGEEFRSWLREGLGLAMTQWGAPEGLLAERALEAALRDRIEAQHGWQFENCWPSGREHAVLERALGAARHRRAARVLRAAAL